MATLMLEGGACIRHIQEILGHASVATTEIYTHVSIRHLQIAVPEHGLDQVDVELSPAGMGELNVRFADPIVSHALLALERSGEVGPRVTIPLTMSMHAVRIVGLTPGIYSLSFKSGQSPLYRREVVVSAPGQAVAIEIATR